MPWNTRYKIIFSISSHKIYYIYESSMEIRIEPSGEHRETSPGLSSDAAPYLKEARGIRQGKEGITEISPVKPLFAGDKGWIPEDRGWTHTIYSLRLLSCSAAQNAFKNLQKAAPLKSVSS